MFLKIQEHLLNENSLRLLPFRFQSAAVVGIVGGVVVIDSYNSPSYYDGDLYSEIF